MSDNVILSAAVRQNLLALQNTAQLMATTQQRLATGKKVNSALDNPSAYFTSQALTSRASDLQHVLDQIGQAVQTINAANNGITSITQLVQSAKSLAQQAEATTAATSSYSSIDASSNILAPANLNGSEVIATATGTANLEPQNIAITGKTITETLGQASGAAFANNAAVTTAFPGGGANDGIVEVKVTERNGTVDTFDVALNHTNTTTTAQLLSNFNTFVQGGKTLGNFVTASYDATNHLTLTANTSDVSFSISAGGSGSTAATLAATGLSAGNFNSQDLLSQLTNASGDTMVIAGNDSAINTPFAPQTITFGTGAGQVATLADLNTQLAAAATASGHFSASATPTTSANGSTITGHISIGKTAGTYSSVVTIGGTITTLSANSAVLESSPGGVFGIHNSEPTLADLDPVNLANGGALSFTVNGQNYNVGLSSGDRIGDIITKLNSSAVGAYVNFTQVTDNSGHNHIVATGKDASVALTINANDTSLALGLTAGNNQAINSVTPPQSDLLTLLNAKLGGNAGQGATLTVSVNGGLTQTITFGTGSNQVQTIAQLNTALAALSGVTAGVTNGVADINVAAGNTATSLTLGGTAATAIGLTPGIQNGTVLSTTSNSTRASLQVQYNAVLAQIDTMAKDSSYNGVNLLGGDNLTIAYNSDGSSSQTVNGTVVNSANLGLSVLNGTQFQDDTQLQTIIAATNTAVTTLSTQASTLGSALTTVQARQSFTTAMVNTLQTGSDNLVLADTNLEGANMLTLQTRQQLSTTALSLANQANQAVLRLFG